MSTADTPMRTTDRVLKAERISTLGERTSNAIARKRVDLIMHGVLLGAVILALIPLALILYEVIKQGLSAMSLEFLTSVQTISLVRAGGGYLNGLVGTLYMVTIAVLIAVPLGIAAAMFVVEYSNSKLVPFIQFFTDVMTGVPSIFVGLFIYTILVQSGGGFSSRVALPSAFS
ncbi:MAG: hypothetical protein P8Z40_05980 [Chloroflexota bacterium]